MKTNEHFERFSAYFLIVRVFFQFSGTTGERSVALRVQILNERALTCLHLGDYIGNGLINEFLRIRRRGGCLFGFGFR